MTRTGVRLSGQLTTVKRQPDAARRDLAPVTVERHKANDKNDQLRPSLAALREAFPMSHLSQMRLMSQFEPVFNQLSLAVDVNDEVS